MAAQTSYATNIGVAFAGMLGDLNPHSTETIVSAESSAEIPFGVFVAKGGSTDSGGIMPAASTAKLRGVLLAGDTRSKGVNGDIGTLGLKPKCLGTLLMDGRVWVVSETAVNFGDPVFVRYAAGAGGTQLGAVRNATVASEMIDLTSKARFVGTIAAPGLVQIELDMTA